MDDHSAFFTGVNGLKLYSEYADGYLSLRLRGDLDHHSARETMALIEGAMDRHLPKTCSLDLSGLGFMDSSGIAVLLRARKRMEETGGRFWVSDVSAQPERVLSASGVARIVSIQHRKGATKP